MVDKADVARKVFSIFQAEHDRNAHRTGLYLWSMDLRGNDSARAEELGLDPNETGVGLAMLAHKGLLKARTATAYMLTPEGREACFHPELVDDYLAPRRPNGPSTPGVTITGGNVQVGDHNNQTITYGSLLRTAARAIEQRDDLSKDRRAQLAAAFRDACDVPDIEALMARAAKSAGDE